MEKLKVKNVIISKQKEDSENFRVFLRIVKEKNIKVIIVKSGDKITFENELYMDILWPQEEQIAENPLNNNSIVAKLVYKEFSMLFTGDIEEIAEKAILNKYHKNLNILNATVLKIAHHGSKTSSTKSFLEAVNPKIAVIGVGKNNKFGHPSDITLGNLEVIKCRIYRTDENGEISIYTNGKRIKVEKFIE